MIIDDYKGLWQVIWLVTINIWLNFLFKINLLLASNFHTFIGPCTHMKDLPRYKIDCWFLSVTLNWIINYKCQTKVFWIAKQYLVVITKLPSSWNTTAFSVLGLKGKHVFISFFKMLANKCETLELWSYRKMELEKNHFWDY